jgi:hypothetical protein
LTFEHALEPLERFGWGGVEHRRRNHAGVDGVDPHTVRAEFQGRRPGHAGHGEFRRRVTHHAGHADQAVDGGDIHDGTGALGRHDRSDGADAEVDTVGVDRPHLVVVFGILVAQWTGRNPNPRVVDEDVQSAERLDRGRHRSRPLCFLGHIEGQGERVVT